VENPQKNIPVDAKGDAAGIDSGGGAEAARWQPQLHHRIAAAVTGKLSL